MNNKTLFEKYYVFFLAMIAAIPAMSTDMYISAIPRIALEWDVAESTVSLSLVLWFVSFSVFLLILGPISDKIGRKKVLVSGLGLFTIACFLCSIAANVFGLVAFRILQGASAAAPSSMCMAICRDRYDGITRKRILAYIGVILSVVPMLAPSVGAAMLRYSSWRGIFIIQGVLAAAAFVISLNYTETLAEPLKKGIFAVFGRYINLLSNIQYVLANKTMGLILGPFYGFIAFSPIIYMKVFNLSARHFGILFGLNAFMSMAGAFACTKLTRFFSDIKLLTLALFGCLGSGLGILFFGSLGYWIFAGFMCFFTFCCGLSRPLSNNLILEQVETDIGSASSFMVFYQFIVGAACMALASISWDDYILAFGLLATAMPLFVLVCWYPLTARIKTVG